MLDKFDNWYQQNLPSDDETRQLIDPNQSDDSSMNISFDAFAGLNSRTNHSIVSPSLLKGNIPQSVRTLTPQPVNTVSTIKASGPGAAGNMSSDQGACSYQSDSLSSSDSTQNPAQQRVIKQVR